MEQKDMNNETKAHKFLIWKGANKLQTQKNLFGKIIIENRLLKIYCENMLFFRISLRCFQLYFK